LEKLHGSFEKLMEREMMEARGEAPGQFCKGEELLIYGDSNGI
jgi:hypothetical protein